MKKQRGFTLIELMLVVLIIGILTGVMLGVINIRGIQAKSRDAKRIGDLKKVQTALELYFTDYRGYPESSDWTNVTPTLSSFLTTRGYINAISEDSRESESAPEGVSCFNGKDTHGYYYISNDCVGVDCLASDYVLGAIMEIETSASDDLCSDLSNCNGTISCNCGGSYCYGTENPL